MDAADHRTNGDGAIRQADALFVLQADGA